MSLIYAAKIYLQDDTSPIEILFCTKQFLVLEPLQPSVAIQMSIGVRTIVF